jgi:transposase
MEITTLGIDLAKSGFAVCGADSSGRVVMRRQLRRAQVLNFMRGLPRCVVGMEASGGAQYWARQLTALGHEVRVMSPALVMPYRKGNQTDRNDADAILEAVTRPSMRFVMVKSVAQQDLLALHRVRAQLVKSRTAPCNQLRGLLRERGVMVRTGAAALKRSLPAALADESSELSGEMRELLSEMSQWLRTLEQRIASCEARITRKFKHDERCVRLVRGAGGGSAYRPALVAAVGSAQRFRNGRELSAYLGLVPRQHSSGGKTVLLGITKRGDRYLRTLLIHGARSVLRQCKGDARSGWARRISAERGPNVAAVALANKNARVLWALLTRGDCYRSTSKITSAGLRPGSPPAVKRARGANLRVVNDWRAHMKIALAEVA